MTKFEAYKVGDRVKTVRPFDGLWVSCEVGKTGTVRRVDDLILVEFDAPFAGHDGLGYVPPITSKRGWFVRAEDLRVILEKPKAKFKIGDRVIASGVRGGIDLSGLVGTVEVADYGDRSVGVCFDHPKLGFHSLGLRADPGHGYWVEETALKAYVDEAPKAPDEVPEPFTEYGTFIVVVDKGEGLRPATRPFPHGTKEAAVAEAERLSRKNPDMDFFVFKATSSTRSTSPKTVTSNY
jgi:hypothetical protein